MKVRDLITALEKCDPEAQLRLYGKTEASRCARVVGTDDRGLYRAVFIVSDEDADVAEALQ